MPDITTDGMPAPVQRYFAALNSFDSAGMAAVFPAAVQG